MTVMVATTEPRMTPARRHDPPVRVDVWNDSCRADALAIWRRLERESDSARLTSGADWTETWLAHYASRIPSRFLIGRRGDEVIGIALAAVESGPLGIRTWHLGTAGEPGDDSVCIEFNTLLVRPEDRDDFCREIQRTLTDRSDCDAVSWDGFALADLPEGFAATAPWRTELKPTFYFDLQRARETGVEPITLLGDSTRKGIRQNLRGIDDLQVDWSETPHQIDSYYDELIRFHQERWESAGEPGSFASRVFRDFHRELLHRLVPRGSAAVVRVRIGGRTIGCTLLHVDRNRVLVYQGGWGRETGLKSPGLVNDYACLCECLRRGYDAYDFMAGDSIHKRRMTTDQGRLLWATYRKPSWKWETLDRLRAARRFYRSFWMSSAAFKTPESSS